MISLSRLQEVLEYDAETGIFTWKVTLNARGAKGTRAGTSACHGYRHIQIDGKRYYEHILAWLISGKEIPSGFEIDHDNLDKSDNRLDNLRLVSKSQNQHNRGINKNNTSGVKGVSFCKQTGMWKARVTLHGKEYTAGRHKTLDEAAEAVKLKRNELHGEFARHS